MDTGGFGEGANEYFQMEREASNENKIEYLEVENKSLRNKIKRRDIKIKDLKSQLTKAKAQIENMKCCGNCENWDNDKQFCHKDK